MTKLRMKCSSAQLRREFLKSWINGLKICGNLGKNMSVSDRKRAIKSSADVAIASTSRNASAKWSRALIADVASRDNGNNKALVECVAGCKLVDRWKTSARMIKCSKKILRSRISIVRQKARKRVLPKCAKRSSIIAKNLVEKRTRVLKTLVPGGEAMDAVSLIREALDYIVSLKVQRDVMKHVVGTAEKLGLFN